MTNDYKREEDIRALLKERVKIDELLRDRFTREVTIMFTDIKGSTAYFETRGDINGLSMVFRHNELLFPIIKHHQGTVIKTIGDSIMASFPDALHGVKAAIEMQQTLFSHNAKHQVQDQIQIRIGLNGGRGIVENRDIFGDVVNLAARIESLAEPGQILISQTVYEAVKQADDIICRYFDSTKVKGKEESVEVYHVIWGEEEVVSGSNKRPVKQHRKERNVLLPDIFRKKSGIALGIGILLIISLVMGIIVEKSKVGVREVGSEPYRLAYQQLKQGRLEEARESFSRMKPEDALRFEGFAAVSFKSGEYEKSLVMCEQALKTNQGNFYSRVIKGNIFLNQGKIDEAVLEYEGATQLSKGARWQQAEAYNRLGRIYASQYRVEEALSMYAQAAIYNPDSPEIYTNQGILTERSGNLSEAVSLYRKALDVEPQNQMALTLLKEATHKKKLEEDSEKNQEIDKLVDELIKSYNERKEKGLSTEEDEWSSKPITISFLNFQKRGVPSIRDGEDEYLMLKLTSKLQEEGRVHIVERVLLDKLLEELKLSSSDLANPELALKVGRIVAARLIATGSITRYGNDLQVSMRLIEPETTFVKITVMESAEKGMGIDEFSKKISQDLMEKLKSHYPLRGRIVSLESRNLVLDIGADQGVKPGTKMKVLAEGKPVQIKGKMIVPKGREIGKIEITSVEPNLAYARIIEKYDDIQVGFKIEELVADDFQPTASL
jgi:class 3 adenylate cyclase/tetratricopeptide (TPR) repeat protein